MTFLKNLTFLGLLVPVFATAGIVVPACTSSEVCNYSLSISGIDPAAQAEDTSSTWTLDFTTLGPEKYNAPDNFLQSFVVSGSPASGWVYDAANSGLTSYGTDGAAFVTFDDTNNDGLNLASVSYEVYGSDAFWATLGGPFTFGATEDPSANSGAFFNFQNSSQIVTDPPCTECTVTITASSATPEPGSLFLLVPALGLLGLFARKLRVA